MHTVYLIKSKHYNWCYVGMTQDLQKRLSHHNSGKVKSTKFYKPFKIVYLKQFQTRDLARDHEKYLKIRSNKERIIKTLS